MALLTTSSQSGHPGTFNAFQRLRKFPQFDLEQLMQYPAFARLRLRLQKRPVKTDVLSRDEVLERTRHSETPPFNRSKTALCCRSMFFPRPGRPDVHGRFVFRGFNEAK